MPETPEAPPTTGPIAGKYELVRLIGRGGMGTVWEGRHSSLGTRVAIKFIDAEYADSQEARARFDNEARAAATIQSKHAIQIYDHGCTDDGKPYIVMELLVGEPLDARVDRLKQLPLAETTRILRQVARALARAHERGIVHRDLKPENVFLVRTPDEDEEIAKVLDFGIAKFKKVDGQTGSGVSSSTKTGAVLGTPFYMSPEQARGLREIDHRSDLWSMGVIAFKCVCGVLPFEGVSVGDLLVKICTTPAPVPSMLVPSLPTSFDAWFARALEKDPARRFQSAGELSDALADATGLSVKRAGSVSPTSDPIGVPAASFPPPRSTEIGPSNQTSAPFTSPARTGASSRSVYVAAIVATALGVALGTVAVLRRGQPQRGAQGTVMNATPARDAPSALAVTTPTPDAGAVAPLVVVTDLPHEKGTPHHAGHPTAPKAAPPAVPTPLPPITAPPAQAAVASPPPAPEPKPAPTPAPKASANVMDPGY
jgi:serine/threonine-protein kinase